jgi:hypothetical protein
MKVLNVRDFVLSKLERGYYTFSLKEVEGALASAVSVEDIEPDDPQRIRYIEETNKRTNDHTTHE